MTESETAAEIIFSEVGNFGGAHEGTSYLGPDLQRKPQLRYISSAVWQDCAPAELLLKPWHA